MNSIQLNGFLDELNKIAQLSAPTVNRLAGMAGGAVMGGTIGGLTGGLDNMQRAREWGDPGTNSQHFLQGAKRGGIGGALWGGALGGISGNAGHTPTERVEQGAISGGLGGVFGYFGSKGLADHERRERYKKLVMEKNLREEMAQQPQPQNEYAP